MHKTDVPLCNTSLTVSWRVSFISYEGKVRSSSWVAKSKIKLAQIRQMHSGQAQTCEMHEGVERRLIVQ